MESSSTFKRIFSPNGNIEKIPAPLRSHISSPKSPMSGSQTWLLLVIPYLSLKNSLPNHKTHIAGKRLSMFVTIRFRGNATRVLIFVWGRRSAAELLLLFCL
ncbi:hypothetical protein AVEN_243166-1 [Araneus ventricosus]|uniref:Uncharacterized protein n=1 Tax=Araneus ventricosus TaxID=182803 RepID=A0A4Y2XCT3_ARAVE|nr:hypothetical protein AVEN_100989-1 [Araneus ventricosus]GBO46814.1 hypothetical protein AVEN_243166-1 [Araneus ventricosus]